MALVARSTHVGGSVMVGDAGGVGDVVDWLVHVWSVWLGSVVEVEGVSAAGTSATPIPTAPVVKLPLPRATLLPALGMASARLMMLLLLRMPGNS